MGWILWVQNPVFVKYIYDIYIIWPRYNGTMMWTGIRRLLLRWNRTGQNCHHVEYSPWNMQSALFYFVLLSLYNPFKSTHVINLLMFFMLALLYICSNGCEVTVKNIGKINQYQTTTQLTQSSRDKNVRHFADDTFRCIFLKENVRISIKNFTEVCS